MENEFTIKFAETILDKILKPGDKILLRFVYAYCKLDKGETLEIGQTSDILIGSLYHFCYTKVDK